MLAPVVFDPPTTRTITARQAAEAPSASGEVRELSAACGLPLLQPAHVAALNLAYRRRHPLRAALPTGDCLIALRHDPAAAPAAQSAYDFRLGARRGRIDIPPQAESRLLAEPDAQGLPLALRYVLMSDALGSLIERLESATGQRFEWTLPDEGESAAAERTEPLLPMDFELVWERDPASPQRGRLWLADVDLLARAAEVYAAEPPQPCPAIDALRLPLAFEIGRTPLALQEVRGICSGDIVAIEQWQSHQSAVVAVPVLAHSQRLSWTAYIDGAHATLQPWKEFTMTSITAPDASAAATHSLERLDGMEMAIRFEVGEMALSLRELRALQPGHVFDLGQPLNRSTVRIYAHGNLLGHGHLVAVGDRLGVRVSQFAPDLEA